MSDEKKVTAGDLRRVEFSFLAHHSLGEIKLLNKSPSCAICIDEEHNDPYETFVLTDCNHVFHLGCLNKWFRRCESNVCPMCKTECSLKNRDDEEIDNYLLSNCIRLPIPDSMRCAICFGSFEDDRAPWIDLQCGHSYHFDCFTNWRRRRNLCPLDNKTPYYVVVQK